MALCFSLENLLGILLEWGMLSGNSVFLRNESLSSKTADMMTLNEVQRWYNEE